MTLSDKLYSWLQKWSQPRPQLLAILPMHLGHLNNTFYLVCAYNNGLQTWCITHCHLPTSVVIRYSFVYNLFYKISHKLCNLYMMLTKVYPTGIYTVLPPHIRLTSDVQVVAWQSPNTPVSQEIINQVADYVLDELNKNKPNQNAPLHFSYPDLSTARVIH